MPSLGLSRASSNYDSRVLRALMNLTVAAMLLERARKEGGREGRRKKAAKGMELLLDGRAELDRHESTPGESNPPRFPLALRPVQSDPLSRNSRPILLLLAPLRSAARMTTMTQRPRRVRWQSALRHTLPAPPRPARGTLLFKCVSDDVT